MSEEKTIEKHAEMISQGDRKTRKSGETGKTGKSGKAGTSKKPGQKRTRVSPAKKKLALEVIERLKAEYPVAECTLDYENAWQLLVSVRLAAQCTDARVDQITPLLYEKFPDVPALAAAEPEETEESFDPGLPEQFSNFLGVLDRRAEYDSGLVFHIFAVGIDN